MQCNIMTIFTVAVANEDTYPLGAVMDILNALRMPDKLMRLEDAREDAGFTCLALPIEYTISTTRYTSYYHLSYVYREIISFLSIRKYLRILENIFIE